MLKATIRSRPNATRCSEIAASRTTSAVGQGRIPPEIPTATSPLIPLPGSGTWLCPCCRGRGVAVVVIVAVLVAVTVHGPVARAKHDHADRDDEQRRGEVEPRIEILGNDELREAERDEAEREDTDRVRDRDDPAEQERVSRLAARADHVAGDDRLPVAGRERVRSAPEHCDEERDEHEADAQLLLGDERSETALVRRRRSTGGLGRAVERRRHTALGSRLERRPRARRPRAGSGADLPGRRAAGRSSSPRAPSLRSRSRRDRRGSRSPSSRLGPWTSSRRS